VNLVLHSFTVGTAVIFKYLLKDITVYLSFPYLFTLNQLLKIKFMCSTVSSN